METGRGPLRLRSLKTVEPQTRTGRSFTPASPQRLLQLPCPSGSPLSYGIPFGNSWEVIKLPFCSVGPAPTTAYLPRRLTESGRAARRLCPLLLGVRPGQDCQEGRSSGVKGGWDYHWVMGRLVQSRVPSCSAVAGPLEMSQRIIRRARNQAAFGEVGFILCRRTQASSHAKFWALGSGVIGFL